MERKLRIVREYLYIPIQIGKPEYQIEIFLETEDKQKKIFEFMIPVGDRDETGYPYDYLARFPVKQFTDKTITLKGEVSEDFGNGIYNGPFQAIDPQTRPAIHFTPECGWINDPNGMVYANGLFHLYFQYNLFNISWNNMSWGHAVSKDLLHWEQQDSVLFPDEEGTIFSGCGLINERGLLGIPKDALVFFYTAAGNCNQWSEGKEATQRIAYSVDNGMSLTKIKPYLATISKENRDPKIFWHEETKAYIMVLWLEENDFAILRSENLETWSMSDRFSLQDAWECPDLLKLSSESGSTYWAFFSADGFYYWGTFDGYRFITDGRKNTAYLNTVPYAAQTFSGISDRVVAIPWLRLANKGRLYTGAMGIPRELSVKESEGKKYLQQFPVQELYQARTLVWEKKKDIPTESYYTIKESAALWIEMELSEHMDSPIYWQIHGTEVSLSVTSGQLRVGETCCRLDAEYKEFSFLVDGNVFEVFFDRGIMSGAFELETMGTELTMDVQRFERIQIFEIR